jgi:hypothetical protein
VLVAKSHDFRKTTKMRSNLAISCPKYQTLGGMCGSSPDSSWWSKFAMRSVPRRQHFFRTKNREKNKELGKKVKKSGDQHGLRLEESGGEVQGNWNPCLHSPRHTTRRYKQGAHPTLNLHPTIFWNQESTPVLDFESA